jgi:hypothetical protein
MMRFFAPHDEQGMIVVSGSMGLPHLPHLGFSLSRDLGIRFPVWQELHRMIALSECILIPHSILRSD